MQKFLSINTRCHCRNYSVNNGPPEFDNQRRIIVLACVQNDQTALPQIVGNDNLVIKLTDINQEVLQAFDGVAQLISLALSLLLIRLSLPDLVDIVKLTFQSCFYFAL